MAQQQPRHTHASEQCAVVVRRCSSRIDATKEGAAEAARRSGCSPASPLEVEDLLREILVRLPPQPSSLPCASAVCKRWQQLVTDPKFLHRFRVHHKKPPLLGFFHQPKNDIVFTPALGPSDRIPPPRFDLRPRDIDSGTKLMIELLDCRHGRVLVLLTERERHDVIVCDPITGEQHGLPSPPKFDENYAVNGAVFCAISERHHVHGSCHSSPFKVVLISYLGGVNGPIACVYSSNTGMWGDIILVDVPNELAFSNIPGLLVGNALYWLLNSLSHGILEFDLEEQSLAVINGPTITNDSCHDNHWIIQLEDGAVGIAVLSYPRFQLWKMNGSCHGVDTWMMWKTIDMHNILGLPQLEGDNAAVKRILGCVQDTNEILLSVDHNIYMVQLKSMQSRKLCKHHWYSYYHCFQSFYPPGPAISGG